MIRRTIVEQFKSDGTPAALEAIATRLGLSKTELTARLSTEERLDDLCGLSPRQVRELIDFYGSETLFTELIVSNIRAFTATRERIQRVESRKRRGKNGPPSSDKNG